MVVLMAWSKVVASRGQGSGRALIVARLIVVVRGTAAAGVEFLVTFVAVAWGKGFWGWSRQRWWYARSSGSGVRGWDEWCAIGWCSWPRSDICEELVGRSQCLVRELGLGETG